MGSSLSLLLSFSKEILLHRPFGLGDMEGITTIGSTELQSKDGETLRTISFKKSDLGRSNVDESDCGLEESIYFDKIKKPAKLNLQTFKNLIMNGKNFDLVDIVLDGSAIFSADHNELAAAAAAATTLEKGYWSYQTRRNLADCAMVVEEQWGEALDFAALRWSSTSFFDYGRLETAVSRWARARNRAAKVGKGLCKCEKAKKLDWRHWLEAIDPQHRYGHNLHFYYNVWLGSDSSQPFFYWLDVGDGKDVYVEECSRTQLQCQCVKYLGKKEREEYEVIVEDKKLLYKKTRLPVDTIDGSKWIFVLSASRKLYVWKKQKGLFQHSSFLSGGAAIAAGRLVARSGVLEATWGYSGHYRPSDENFQELISFLEEQYVDLTNVKKVPIDDDIPPSKISFDEEIIVEKRGSIHMETISSKSGTIYVGANGHIRAVLATNYPNKGNRDVSIELEKLPSCKWTSGVEPRLICVRECPTEIQSQVHEHANLSPKVMPGGFASCCPVPSS